MDRENVTGPSEMQEKVTKISTSLEVSNRQLQHDLDSERTGNADVINSGKIRNQQCILILPLICDRGREAMGVSTSIGSNPVRPKALRWK